MPVDPVTLLIDSLKTYSPSSEESEQAAFLREKMKAAGYSRVRIDRAGNALGEAGRGSVELLLCGHMDTVPGRLPVKKNRDTIYGRGAADAKSPLCAMLLAGPMAQEAGVHVTFAAVTREESDGLGIKEIIKSGKKFDFAIFGEPGGADKVTVGYRGRVEVGVTVNTHGGHAGSPWVHRSAFEEFESLLAKLRRYEAARAVPGDHFNSVSISPTLVRAGTHENVLPGICEATLDVRVPPKMRSSEVVDAIRSAAEESSDGSSVRVTFEEATEPYLSDRNSSLVRALQRAIILRLKSRPVFVKKTGTGDMNTFAAASGAQCATYGPGLAATSHTDGEAVLIDDYLRSIDVLTEAIKQLGSLSSRRRG